MPSVLRNARTWLARRRAPLECSGCGRPQEPHRRLVSGPSVYACEGCIRGAESRVQETARGPLGTVTCAFCGERASGVPLGAGEGLAACVRCVDRLGAVLREHDARSAT